MARNAKTVQLVLSAAAIVAISTGCSVVSADPAKPANGTANLHANLKPSAAGPHRVIEYKNSHYVDPRVATAENGSIIEVSIDAPFTVSSAQMYHKEGLGCGWTHECPNGTFCPEPYKDPWVFNGKNAKWRGWSNSGENCALYFSLE